MAQMDNIFKGLRRDSAGCMGVQKVLYVFFLRGIIHGFRLCLKVRDIRLQLGPKLYEARSTCGPVCRRFLPL